MLPRRTEFRTQLRWLSDRRAAGEVAAHVRRGLTGYRRSAGQQRNFRGRWRRWLGAVSDHDDGAGRRGQHRGLLQRVPARPGRAEGRYLE